jgi:hypothetical protein
MWYKPILEAIALCQGLNSVVLDFVPYKVVLVMVHTNRVLRQSEDRWVKKGFTLLSVA